MNRISLFLIFVLLSTVGVARAEEFEKNIVPNPSFEEGSDMPSSWVSKIDSGECILKWEEEGSEGKKCISIENLDNESFGSWKSEYFSVEHGRDYLFFVKGKLKLQDENKRAYFHITSKENIFITHFQPVYITDTSWNIFKGKVITIPDGVSLIQCRVSLLNNTEGQKVWIDEVKLIPLPELNIKEEGPVFSDSFNDITRWNVNSGQRESYNIIEDNKNRVLEFNDPTLGMIDAEWIGKNSADVQIKLRIKILNPVLLEAKPVSFGTYMIMEEYSSGGGMDSYNFIIHFFHNHIGGIDLYEQKGKSERYLTSGYTNQALGRELEINQWHELIFQKTGRLIKIFVNEVPVLAWYDFEDLKKPVNKVRLRFWKAQGMYQIDDIVVIPVKVLNNP